MLSTPSSKTSLAFFLATTTPVRVLGLGGLEDPVRDLGLGGLEAGGVADGVADRDGPCCAGVGDLVLFIGWQTSRAEYLAQGDVFFVVAFLDASLKDTSAASGTRSRGGVRFMGVDG